MASDTVTPPRKRLWRRLLVAAGGMVLVAVLVVTDARRRDIRRVSLATEIQRAGGYAELPKSFGETIQFWRRAGEFPPRRTYAHLRGPAFSNQ